MPAQELVVRGLASADALGADGCIVLVEENSHVDVRFALNTTTTNGVQRGRSVSVIALSGRAFGSARRSGEVGADGVAEMAAAALADARSASPAPDAFPLVTPSEALSARDFGLDPPETDSGALEGVLGALSGAFGRARARDAVLAGFAEQDLATIYLGSSTGLRLSFAQPTAAVSLVGRTTDGTGSAWVGEPTIAPSLERMEQEIWRRLDWATTQVALDAGRYEVIMPPSAVGDMMAMLAFDALGGQDAEDGRTVFSKEGGGTRVGETITTLPFSLLSDPFEEGIACTPFVATGASSSEVSVFDDGLPCARTEWLRDGVLARLRAHRAGAARSGVAMAPYIDNLVLRCGDHDGGSVDDMVARTERGLLLTCLWYIREVDPATLLCTGLTRDGVYVIENGAVVGAANNFRFNESPVDLLTRATEVGTPIRSLGREFGEYLNRTIMPPLRIPDYNMSSVSQAS
ncbi:MAG TPA: metallopeptidase TldD-related protein [Acidimicrobiales bacterium]|jgi:predicted Zn-dependent protease|nr:metallopeptidase TldD-related protein [Acidimicrobiales bacterium]